LIPQGDNIPTASPLGEGLGSRRVFDGESALARINEMRERIAASASASKDLTERLGQLRVTARDDNEVAEVTVDASGNVVDLSLSAKVQTLYPGDSARFILEAIRAAKALLPERTREIVADTIGADSTAGKAVLKHLDDRLGPDGEDGDSR
jgi:DNA-binding protein YbaB